MTVTKSPRKEGKILLISLVLIHLRSHHLERFHCIVSLYCKFIETFKKYLCAWWFKSRGYIKTDQIFKTTSFLYWMAQDWGW